MGLLNIIKTEPLVFSDRVQAGRMLAEHLGHWRRERDLMALGIPRGGVIIADQIAQASNVLLDIVLTRKIGAPHNPELAIGAVSEDGSLFLNNDLVDMLAVSHSYIEQTRNDQLAEIQARRNRYRHVLRKHSLAGKTVVLTDDGIATGATMQASIWAAKSEKPDRIILAVPVGPPDTVDRLSCDVDELICLSTPSVFYAIGQFYVEFPQVSDNEVLAILNKYRDK